MVVDIATYVLHGLFAALWTGSVLFVALVVLPMARDGLFEPETFGTIVDRFLWISRVSVLLTLLTGGYLAGRLYTVDTLTGTGAGHLVLTMVALWVGLAATIEIGTARAKRGIEQGKKWQPARDARPFYLAGAIFAIGLLIVAGLVGANRLVGIV